ncbi:MAG: hypothetical protein JXR84_13115 [Anaerolineae bacterium]|nr:hypothetical protein [Anaerolineae bacterium]
MGENDINDLILDQLRKINEEVRRMPKIEARVEAMRDATQQLETAMRETTAGLRMQGEAHSKMISELQLQVHQAVAALTAVSGDMQELTARVKDLERQVQALFTQQQTLSRETRETDECLSDYHDIKSQVKTLSEVVQTLVEQMKVVLDYIPWLRVLKYFLVTAGGLVVLLIIRTIMQLVLEKGVVP